MSHKMLPRARLHADMEHFAHYQPEQYTERLQRDLMQLRQSIKSTVLSLFNWDMPFVMNKNYIEDMLYNHGRIAFAIVHGGLVAVPFEYVANYNLMGQPLFVDLFLYNNAIERQRIEDVVILENRANALSSVHVVNQFVGRLQDLNQALDNNLLHTNRPFILKSEGNTNTFRRFADYLFSGMPVIKLKKDVKVQEEVEVLNTQTEYLGADILNTYVNLRNEMLINLGIPANMTNKSERVTAGEVHNDSYLQHYIYNSMLQNRKDAVKEIQSKFGIRVKLIERLQDFKKEVQPNDDTISTVQGRSKELH